MAKETLNLQGWRADRRSGRLERGGESRSLEPKVMELLFLLGREPGRVFSREEIVAGVWAGAHVNDDALARCIFKLRRALDDDTAAPRFIETIPKRGYRLIADHAEESGLMRRAEEFYFQFTRADNEAAIVLYEQALARDPDDVAALAGLANGLVQRAVRWLDVAEGDTPRSTLGQALQSGVLATPKALTLLAEAQRHGERAVARARHDPAALKALGLAMAAMHRFEDARSLYDRALASDPQAWGVLINLADLDGLEGRDADALAKLERAWHAMETLYESQAVTIRPWHATLGTLIAERYRTAGEMLRAEEWYRRVLARSPLDENATAGLAAVLMDQGDTEAARALCRDLVARIGSSAACARFLA